MSAIFIKYKTSNRHRILLNLTDKINLKRRNKYVALLNLSLYYSVKYANNKLKISSIIRYFTPKFYIFKNILNWEFSFIEVWFTDKKSKMMTLVIKQSATY